MLRRGGVGIGKIMKRDIMGGWWRMERRKGWEEIGEGKEGMGGK